FVFLQAFFDAMQAPDNLKVLQPAMEQIIEGTRTPDPIVLSEEVKRVLRDRAAQALPVLVAGMRTDRFFEAWRPAFLAQVRIVGKGYVVTDHIIHVQKLQDTWSEEVADALFEDPNLTEQVLQALLVGHQDDLDWSRRMQRQRQQLIYLLLEDRVLFEQ